VAGSVEAKIEKKEPARFFYSISFTHDPVSGGIVGVSAHPPVQPVCALAFVVFTGVVFLVVLAPPDLGYRENQVRRAPRRTFFLVPHRRPITDHRSPITDY